MTKPLKIWCNMSYDEPLTRMLREGIGRHELVLSAQRLGSNLGTGQPDPLLMECDVAFGQPDVTTVMQSQRLKWVHLSTAGYERFDEPALREALARRNTLLTTSSGVYDEPCAQHVLGMMLALSRRLPEALDNQRGRRGWPAFEVRAGSYLLLGQSALLLGFGAIARRLVELLSPFQMKLWAVRRRVVGDEPIPTYAQEEVDRLLPEADHVINVLPGGTGTRLFLDAARIGLMKPGAVLYNIGRGNTVDHDALRAALDAGRLAGAYLDVTDPEPLPPEHPLWTTPRCHITPHSAGGHANEFPRIIRHFLANLQRFEAGEEMLNRVV